MNVTTHDYHLNVTNNGGVGVSLSRLWIVVDLDDGLGGEIHNYVDLELGGAKWVAAGKTMDLSVPRSYVDSFVGKEVTFTVVTTRGNMAACSCVPYR
jgi:hypothetical protein